MGNLIATAMVGVALSAFGAPAQAETIKINMPSTFPGSLIQLGQAGVRFADTVNERLSFQKVCEGDLIARKPAL